MKGAGPYEKKEIPSRDLKVPIKNNDELICPLGRLNARYLEDSLRIHAGS